VILPVCSPHSYRYVLHTSGLIWRDPPVARGGRAEHGRTRGGSAGTPTCTLATCASCATLSPWGGASQPRLPKHPPLATLAALPAASLPAYGDTAPSPAPSSSSREPHTAALCRCSPELGAVQQRGSPDMGAEHLTMDSCCSPDQWLCSPSCLPDTSATRVLACPRVLHAKLSLVWPPRVARAPTAECTVSTRASSSRCRSAQGPRRGCGGRRRVLDCRRRRKGPTWTTQSGAMIALPRHRRYPREVEESARRNLPTTSLGHFAATLNQIRPLH